MNMFDDYMNSNGYLDVNVVKKFLFNGIYIDKKYHHIKISNNTTIGDIVKRFIN